MMKEFYVFVFSMLARFFDALSAPAFIAALRREKGKHPIPTRAQLPPHDHRAGAARPVLQPQNCRVTEHTHRLNLGAKNR
ncbi:hypothetical protein [Pararhodobacter oceanensis]|uniref:Uncharacterized protein n=1 Tax=Pararhodobacter oceanensis TaxID=2172121 RepID=A0A2T8HTU8_9RHOB|nr:hypothetical protein [Pararhodobacter oceanensis]PVH28835.1 hypothetical protein DDE20_11755 [Pararhodobacter oceanensis]